MSSIDQQFVEFIVKSLVSKPDEVQISRRIDEKGVLLELTVDPEDLGRVIGKRGATAQSLRTLLRALGTKNDARYNLKIVDNGEQHAPAPSSDNTSASTPDDSVQDGSDDTTVTAVPTSSSYDDEETEKNDDRSESMASKTRKELAELDDLDV